MSRLTDEQLSELTALINASLAEFDVGGGPVFDPMTPGLARLVHGVINDWQSGQRESNNAIAVIAPPPPARITYAEPAHSGNGISMPSGAQGSPNTITPTHDNAPSLSEFVAFLQRISKGGVMPSMAQFNSLRPAGWATADAHSKRLELAWGDLAQTAGLESRRKLGKSPGSRPSPENNAVGDFH